MILIKCSPREDGYYTTIRSSSNINISEGWVEVPKELEDEFFKYNERAKPVLDENNNLLGFEEASIEESNSNDSPLTETDTLTMLLDQEIRIAELESKLSNL